jgi:hypothetical protein
MTAGGAHRSAGRRPKRLAAGVPALQSWRAGRQRRHGRGRGLAQAHSVVPAHGLLQASRSSEIKTSCVAWPARVWPAGCRAVASGRVWSCLVVSALVCSGLLWSALPGPAWPCLGEPCLCCSLAAEARAGLFARLAVAWSRS